MILPKNSRYTHSNNVKPSGHESSGKEIVIQIKHIYNESFAQRKIVSRSIQDRKCGYVDGYKVLTGTKL